MADRPTDIEAAILGQESFDSTDRKAVNRRRKVSASWERKCNAGMSDLMATTQGRALVYDLLAKGHAFEASYVRGDPHETSFREGERNHANIILGYVQAVAPEQYMVMVNEGKEHERQMQPRPDEEENEA